MILSNALTRLTGSNCSLFFPSWLKKSLRSNQGLSILFIKIKRNKLKDSTIRWEGETTVYLNYLFGNYYYQYELFGNGL